MVRFVGLEEKGVAGGEGEERGGFAEDWGWLVSD